LELDIALEHIGSYVIILLLEKYGPPKLTVRDFFCVSTSVTFIAALPLQIADFLIN
jgi:hypothetical protein